MLLPLDENDREGRPENRTETRKVGLVVEALLGKLLIELRGLMNRSFVRSLCSSPLDSQVEGEQ